MYSASESPPTHIRSGDSWLTAPKIVVSVVGTVEVVVARAVVGVSAWSDPAGVVVAVVGPFDDELAAGAANSPTTIVEEDVDRPSAESTARAGLSNDKADAVRSSAFAAVSQRSRLSPNS